MVRLRRSAGVAPAQVAEAIRGLAALVRCGMTARQALAVWHERVHPSLVEDLQRLARRVQMGQTLPAAVRRTPALGSAGGDIAFALEVHLGCGGDLAGTLDAVARTAARRVAATAHAASHSAGAKLSAKTVAVLPFVFIPLMGGGIPTLDVVGLGLLLVGGALMIGGLRWIAALSPRRPPEPEALRIATIVAAAVRGGASLWTALDRAAIACAESGMATAHRRVLLGTSWSDALIRSDDDDLARLGHAIRNAEELGVPVAGALDRFATVARADATARFEAATRRAPVKMIVPLTTCVLPGFCLSALGPFLRELAA